MTECATWSTTGTTAFRQYGFHQVQIGFETIPATPTLNRTIVIDRVRIHIVGDRNLFSAPAAAAFGSPILGYATAQNEIWLFGKVVDGRIVVNQVVLGHELNHLLNFKDPAVADPDKLDDMGL